MKTLLKIVIVLIILLIVAVAIGFLFVDAIAKRAVEESGTAALGVSTTLDKANVGITSGTFQLEGLRVANPEGFTSAHFMTLGTGAVNVDFKSLTKDTVELPELTLTGIDVNLDRKGLKGNYDVIFENLKKLESKGESSGTGKQFVIRTVSVNDINVHVDVMPIGGDATKLDLKIDNVTVNDVGSGGDSGLALAQVWDVLMKAIFAAVIEKGGGIIPEDILGGLGDGLAGLGSLSEMGINFTAGALENVGKVGEDIVKGVGEELENVGKGLGEGLGGLLGGEKKSDDGDDKK